MVRSGEEDVSVPEARKLKVCWSHQVFTKQSGAGGQGLEARGWSQRGRQGQVVMCVVCWREEFRLCHLSTHPGGAMEEFHMVDWPEGVRAEGRSGGTQADFYPRMLFLAVVEDRFGVAGVTSVTQAFWFQGQD